MDIVYFVKDAQTNNELRYSIRSVVKNMPYKRIWIFGGCPYNITPDVHVRAEQNGHSKWENVHNMYQLACSNKELTDNFIMFNDDFYIMQPMSKIIPMYRCTLDEHIALLEAKFAHSNNYTKILRRCNEELKELGKSRLSYELHVPFIFNKHKLEKLINRFPKQNCTRTLYGNLYSIGGVQSNDVKIFSPKPDFDYKNSPLLSSEDGIDNVNNDAWRYIRQSLREKSGYEK